MDIIKYIDNKFDKFKIYEYNKYDSLYYNI